VQLKRKAALLPLSLLAMAWLGAGCSGINTSHGVSPATFLLPGFFGEAPLRPASHPEPAPTPPANSAPAFAPAN